MAITLIFRNLTGAEQIVNDLGVFVPASGQVDVTNLFAHNRYAPSASVNLATFINNNILILNNGTSDIAKLSSAAYLDTYSLATHDINTPHTGTFPESRISNDGILARVASAATITAPWTFNGSAGGQLMIENGITLPTGTIATGRVFWLSSDRTLHVGAGGVWNNITVTQNSFYNAPVMFEFGSYATIGTTGAYINTQWVASNTAPAIMARQGTIKSLSADAARSSGTVTGYTMTLRKLSGSTWVDMVTITKTGALGYVVVTGVNVDFNQYEQISCFLKATGTSTPVVTNGHLYMEVIWREIVATRTLIIQNLTSSPVAIDDLGIYIPASGAINVTNLFSETRSAPFESASLIEKINTNILIINNGLVNLSATESIKYLSAYMVADHDMLSVHTGNLLESNISPDGILARTNLPATIAANWSVGANGNLIVENGVVLPAEGSIATGRLFWHSTEKKLYNGSGGVWNNVLVTQNSRYNAPIVYEFGSSGTVNASSYLSTSWAVSTSTPVIVPLNGTLKAICAKSTNTRSYTCAIRKLVGTTWTTIASVSAATGGYTAFNSNLSVNFAAGDKLACQVSAGRMTNGYCYIEVVWRL